MSRGKVVQPKKLAKKLVKIRLSLGLTQEKMAAALSSHDVKVYTGYVGVFETGYRTPSLLVTLAYAKLANISSDYLIDDELDIPAKLPAKKSSKK